MTQDLDGILARVSKCALCADLPFAPNPLFQLHAQTRILIAGQAPGRATHFKGRPFDDASGQRLRHWLNLDETRFYNDPKLGIFPMGLCFPGAGNSGDLPPKPLCAETWRRPILQALRNVKITLVLGAHAIAWHAPEFKGKPVAEAVERAALLRRDLFILPHPSPRNNRWLKKNAWFEERIVPQIQARVADVLRDG